MERASERRAAVVRRGTAREKRDLFAPQPLDHGSVKQTAAPSFNGVAARNESSVLFAVAAIRPSEKATTENTEKVEVMSASMPPHAPLESDDDGIIDLMALSSR